MPHVNIPIRDLHPSVERPVILGVVKDLLDIIELSERTPINYYGVDGKLAQQNSTLGELGVSSNRWNYDERVFIEVEESADPAFRWATLASARSETHSTFHDPRLDIVLKPVYSVQRVKVNFKYRAADKHRALMWRNEVRSKMSLNHDIFLHTVNYGYSIPGEVLVIVKHLHELREAQGGYQQSWGDYWTEHLTSYAAVHTNQSGASTSWVVAERQQRVQGYMDTELEPEIGSREGDQDNWVVSFTYTFQYTKPIQFALSYPIVVHNQVIDQAYRPAESLYRLEDHRRYFSLSGQALEYFSADQRSMWLNQCQGVNLPLFDEWRIPAAGPGLLPIFSALCSVTETQKRELFNLGEDLEDYKLHDDILSWLRVGEYSEVIRPYGSILQLHLYENGKVIEQGLMRIDAQLNLSVGFDMDIRKTYRVVGSLVSDFTYLTTKTIARLQAAPRPSLLLAEHINAILSGMGPRPDIGKRVLSASDYTLITGRKYHPTYGRNATIQYGEMTVVPSLLPK